MKHFKLTFLLAILMSMVGVNSFAYDFEVDGIYYNYSDDGASVYVTNLSSYYYTGDVIIPESVTNNGKTYNVTSIGNSAFYGCSGLTSVTIPNSVTSIGQNAFSDCSGLTSVIIPNSVTSLGGSAFRNCTGLTSVTIPNSVTTIGESAFNGTAWYDNQPDGLIYIGSVAYKYKGTMPDNTSITIKEGTVSISSNAFYSCSGLTSVTIPNSVTSIGSHAFYQCSGLTSVTIPNSVTSIDSYTFVDCSGLTSVTIGNSVTTIGYLAFKGCSGLTSVTIPNSVTTIRYGAFQNCSNLTSVTIPNSVTSIGDGVFSGTAWYNIQPDGLIYIGSVAYKYKGRMQDNTNITIKEGTVSVSPRAFINCSGLTSVTIGNNVTSIGESAFNGCTGLTSATIGNSVTSIGGEAFYGCSGLTSVTIPNSVTSIGMSAFSGCSGLPSVTIPNSVTSIGDGAFRGCSGLTSVTIPNSVTSIGGSAFLRCSGLTSVTIPNSVTSIGNSAFYDCSNLTSVSVEWNEPISISSNIFTNRTNATLYVPKGSKSAYEAANYWKDFKEIVEVGNLDEQSLELSELPIMAYGDAAYELPQTTTEGLTLTWSVEDTNVAEVNGHLLSINGAGTTTVTATQTGNDEYESFERVFTLTVNKAPLTITANDCSKQEGEENPELTASYEGFVYNDDVSVLTTLPSITTTATIDSPAGEYPITASEAEAANYEITYVEGTLTVTESEEPSSTNSRLYVEETTVRCGSQEVIPVVFESDTEYGGLQCELTLPEGMTLNKITKTERLTDDFTLHKSAVNDNTYQILLYNIGRQSFAGNDGPLFTLTVDVSDEMSVGDYTLKLKDIVVSTIDEQQEDLADFTGTIHVEDYMIGDANRDNRVNVTDIMALANYILRIPGSNFNEKAADINGDTRINVTDIMGIANIILRVNTLQNAPWNGSMLDPQ